MHEMTQLSLNNSTRNQKVIQRNQQIVQRIKQMIQLFQKMIHMILREQVPKPESPFFYIL